MDGLSEDLIDHTESLESVLAERDALSRQLEEARANLNATAHATDSELLAAQQRISQLEQELSGGSLAVDATSSVATLRQERDDLARRLDEASDRLLQIAGADGELARLRRTRDDTVAEADGYRRRVNDLENELANLADAAEALRNERDELRHHAASAEQVTGQLDKLRAHSEALEQQLAEWTTAAEAIAGERDALAAAHTESTQLIEQLQGQLAAAQEGSAELQVSQARTAELEQQLGEIHGEIEQLRTDRDQSQAALTEARFAIEQLEQQQLAHNDQQTARIAELEEHIRSLEAQRDEREASLAQTVADADALRNQVGEQTQRIEQLQAELAELQRSNEDAAASLSKQRDRVATLENELSAWAATGSDKAEELENLRRERDELAHQLSNAATDGGTNDAELQGKFDLAISDLSAARDRISALEHELASQPASGALDLDEMQRLREERDELARQLESSTVGQAPSDELADLQARFEMAVEDVRRLKEENASLQQRSPSQPTDSGGNDWEAQKQRLLAELEGEGVPSDPERQEERATISGTIQITDQVVAEKDREIEQLQAQLAGQENVGDPSVDEAAVAAVLDENEIVRAERERIASLEEELREQLRAAELELSVERAKISRTQQEFEEQQLELETLRAAQSTTGEAGDDGGPKRRWLDKLGLSGEGQ